MDVQWIQAIASAIQAVAVIFAFWQVLLLRKQIKTDHERSRRIRAIDDLSVWNKSLDKAQPSARRLVDSFSPTQCANLVEKKPFYVASNNLKALEYALAGVIQDGELKKTEDGILLNEKHISHLLFLCISHLNSLEIALQGWWYGVADKKIIFEQLKYVVSFKNGSYILENLRQHELLKDNYPAITAFVSELRRIRDSAVKNPQPTIA